MSKSKLPQRASLEYLKKLAKDQLKELRRKDAAARLAAAQLEAGGDVHGTGDAHEGGVIGWATNENPHRAEVIALLVERGARHHIFSAINLGDLNLIEKVVEDDPAALDRRMSRFERGQT